MARLAFGPYAFESSHQDKVLFPAAGITKGELIDHYRAVADTMLPHLADRPLALRRYPDGIDAEGFFQKSVPPHFPAWIRRAAVRKRTDGAVQDLVVCANEATLAYLADQASVELHGWLSRADRPERPDRMVFDLDPPDDDFAPVRRAARRLRALLADLGLRAFVQTTGSRGVHVVVPLLRRDDFGTVRRTARRIAEVLVRRHPAELTTAQRRAARHGRLYVDTGRNAYGQTSVAPYAVRARAEAPVAVPLGWDELADRALGARTYTLRSVRSRLAQRPDAWRGLGRHAQALSRAHAALDSLAED